MKVIEQTPDRLVIEDLAWRVGLVSCAGGAIYAYLLHLDGEPPWQPILAVVVCGLLGWVRAYRQITVFDRDEGFAHLELRRIGWHRRRSIALAEIAAVDLVEKREVSDPTVWRVELKMRSGPNVPLLWEFTSRDEQYRPVATAIGDFLGVPVYEREGRD